MSRPAFDYRALSIAERLQLVEDVWDSTAGERPDAATLRLTAAERAELDRRLGAHTKDPAAAVPWSDVRAALAGPAQTPRLSQTREVAQARRMTPRFVFRPEARLQPFLVT